MWSDEQAVSLSRDQCLKFHHPANFIQYQLLGIPAVHLLTLESLLSLVNTACRVVRVTMKEMF